MTIQSSLREARRLALLLGGEGMQSGLHFALNLLLIAFLPAKDYGTFAFTLVLGGVGLVYVRSLTAMPASIYIGRSRREVFASFYEGAFRAAALVICFVMALIAAAILSIWSDLAEAWSGAAVVGLWSLRSHVRTVGIARKRLGAVTLGDAVFALTGALASAAALRYAPDRLQGVLLSLAFANFAGAVTALLARGASPNFDFGRRARGFYTGLAPRLGWSLFSVTAAILQGQGLAFLVVGFAGPAAYAPIAAMVAFFAPLRIFALSLGNMLQPEISRLSARGDEAGWRALRKTWTLRAMALALLYGDVALVVIPHLHLRSVQGQPVLFIAVFAWVLLAIVLAYLLPRIYLESRMRFREIAASTTVGAVVGLSATALLLATAAPGYSIVGAVLGEAVVAGATWWQAAQPAPIGRASRRRAPRVEARHEKAFEAEPLA
jgi:hypothetical protein